MNFKTISVIIGVLACSLCMFGQTAAQPAHEFFAAGVSYQPGGYPALAGTGLYAKQATDSGTFAFTIVDALPASVKPFTVTTNFAGGIEQRVMTINNVQIFIPVAAGFSYSGTNSGWNWSSGGLALIPLKGSVSVAPNVRVVKSSVNGGSGYQLVGGVLFGWGR